MDTCADYRFCRLCSQVIYLNRTPEDAYRPLVGGTNPPLLAFR